MWKLSADGDSFERRWAPRICPSFREIDVFWARHVVPLTFRVAPEEIHIHFVRPSVKKIFIDYADASYATNPR